LKENTKGFGVVPEGQPRFQTISLQHPTARKNTKENERRKTKGNRQKISRTAHEPKYFLFVGMSGEWHHGFH
jgi:hypothetical protein